MRPRQILIAHLTLHLVALLAGTEAYPEVWQRYSYQLPQPVSRGCPLWMGSTAFLAGGAKQIGDGGSKSWTAMPFNGLPQWVEVNGFLPFAAQGAAMCAAVGDDTIFVAQAAAHAPAVPAEGGSFFFTYTTGGEWTSLPFSDLKHAKRCRAGFFADSKFAYLFGGIDANNQFASQVLIYNMSSSAWSVAGTGMDSLGAPAGFCDCVPLFRRKRIFLICQPCESRGGIPPQTFNISIIEYNPSPPGSFQLLQQLPLPSGAPILAFSATILAQYLVVSVDFPSRSGNGPVVFFFDVVAHQANLYPAQALSVPRFAGTLLQHSGQLLYLGGREYTVQQGWVAPGNYSSTVDSFRAFPRVKTDLAARNYTFSVRSTITIQLNTSTGPAALHLRLATSVDCQQSVSSVVDAACVAQTGSQPGAPTGSWIAAFTAAQAVPKAYVCATFGTCATTSDVPCGVTATNFAECVNAGCCWDSSLSTCYASSSGVADENMFYFNVDPHPIAIVDPAAALPGKSSSYFGSRAGFITIVVTALAVLMIAIAGAAYFLRKKELEHPVECNGKYRLESKIGHGGFGTVFLVHRRAKATEKLAMKYIPCESEEDRRYAVQEFDVIRRAQGHPNMIQLVDMFMSWSDDSKKASVIKDQDKDDSSPTSPLILDSTKSGKQQQPLLTLAPRYVCIIMDYYPEGDLSGLILRQWPQGAPEYFVLNVLCRQVCAALRHLHGLEPPIVHRDLKPENILVAANATKVVLTDFGLARLVEKTYLSTRAGSLQYVAPECWRRHYTCAVDMWGLGCIMYAACTGRVTASTARVMFSDAREKGFERTIRNDLRAFTPLLSNIVLGLLQVDPHKRLTGIQVMAMLDGA